MTIKVSQSSTGSIGVKLKTASKLNVSVSSEASTVAGNLSSLDDVDVSGVSDKFVIMYNATTAKFTAVNPDEVLSAACIYRINNIRDFLKTLLTH
jgi:hypothetical protein